MSLPMRMIFVFSPPLHFTSSTEWIFLYFFDHILVVRRDQLCAIIPVGFISVVFFRVVRSGTHYASLAAGFADGIADLGRGGEGFKGKP